MGIASVRKPDGAVWRKNTPVYDPVVSKKLAEAVVLSGCVGETFDGTVTDIDDRGARVQICDPAVLTRVPVNGLAIGEDIKVRLEEVDPLRRLTRFSLVPSP